MDSLKHEIAMWECALSQNSEAFLNLVEEDALMVCGGVRMTGAEYAEIIGIFDLKSYNVTDFSEIVKTDTLCQLCYKIETKVNNPENADLEGIFNITSTWHKTASGWKLIFNMDSRIFFE